MTWHHVLCKTAKLAWHGTELVNDLDDDLLLQERRQHPWSFHCQPGTFALEHR